jgi:hypothetical protein
MSRRKITPELQAVGKGFSNIDPGYTKLTRMREDDNQNIANLKEAERERRERDLTAEANLDRIQKTEEANLKDIYIEDQVLDTREKALKVNKSIFEDNFEAQQKIDKYKAAEVQSFLTELAPKAIENIKSNQLKDWDETQKWSTSFHLRHGLSLDEQIELDLLEEYQWAKGEELEKVADQLRIDGYTLEEEMFVRGKNSASDYGRLKAYSILAGNQFYDWAIQQLPNMEADTVEQKQAAMEILQDKYLEIHKLKGISADFLEPMFQKMRGGTDKIINGAVRSRSIQQSKERSAEHIEVLAAAYNTTSGGAALKNLLTQKTREVGTDGRSLSPGEAKLAVFKDLQNITNFPSDADVYKLLTETTLTHMNKTWAAANPELVQDLMNQRRIQKTSKANVAKEVLTAKRQEERAEFKSFLDDPERYNGDARVVQQGIDQLFASGHTSEELAPFLVYLDQSVQGRADGDYWREHINDLALNNSLSSEDLTGPYVPKDLKNKYWKQATQNDQLFSTVDLKSIVKDDLGGALRAALKEDSLTTALHPSFEKAKRHAELEFRKEFLRNGGDADKALQNIELKIKNGTGKYSIIEPGKQEIANGVTSFFASFTPGNHDNAPPILNVSTFAERQKIKRRVAKDPTLLHRDLLVKPEKLRDIAKAIKEGRNYRLPEVFYELSGYNPSVMGSPIDIWQQQLKAAQDLGYLEKMNLKIEDFKGTMFRDSKDPLGKEIIQNLRTKADFRKTLQYTYKPDSVRDPKYMSPLVGGTVTNTLPKVYTEEIPIIVDNETIQYLKDSDDFDYDIQEGSNVGRFYRVEV